MAKVRIYDTDRQVLRVELRHLVELLKPRSLQAIWTVEPIRSPSADYMWFDATGEGGDELDRLSQTGEAIAGAAFATVAKNTRQVIWGRFTASLPEAEQQDWVTISAVDSTYYEVSSRDETVLRKVKNSYRDVRPAEDELP